ncbi:MAG: H-NS histone family protein [Lysobacter sp.]|nr:H-NS histone family protein [Lysobacter sp.]
MSIDITRLSSKELDALINQARKRKTTLSKRKPIAVVRSKLTQLAKAEGYTIAELFGGAAHGGKPATSTTKARKTTAGRKLGKVAAKYRNPANPKETWTGRGKQPRWLASETATGRKLDDFLIK